MPARCCSEAEEDDEKLTTTFIIIFSPCDRDAKARTRVRKFGAASTRCYRLLKQALFDYEETILPSRARRELLSCPRRAACAISWTVDFTAALRTAPVTVLEKEKGRSPASANAPLCCDLKKNMPDEILFRRDLSTVTKSAIPCKQY